jgi:TolB-like protein
MEKRALFLAVLMAFVPPAFAEGDPYGALISRLSEQTASQPGRIKVAVLPFAYGDGRSSPGVAIVTEEMVERLKASGKFSVVDMRRVKKAMEVLGQDSRIPAKPAIAKVVGERVGARHVVTGILKDRRTGHVKISARVVSTEDARVRAKASGLVPKTWREASSGGGDSSRRDMSRRGLYRSPDPMGYPTGPRDHDFQ